MKDFMKRFFGGDREGSDASAAPGDEGPRDVVIAACALLLEMARIDDEFSEAEREQIVSALETHFGLSEESAGRLLEAAGRELDESVDLWRFASRINDSCSEEEKIEIIEMIWRLVYTDGTLEEHEDYLIHKLSRLLRLSHKQFIQAKLKVLRENPKRSP